jgi:hypothetical protein
MVRNCRMRSASVIRVIDNGDRVDEIGRVGI